MSSRGDRARAWAAMARSRVFSRGFLAIAPYQYLDIRVRDGGRNNARVDNARIAIYAAFPLPEPNPDRHAPVFQGWTDELGDLIHRLPAGNYHVRARKDWYAPEDDWVHNVNLAARSNQIVRFNMHRLKFYLHVDADRDGTVDDWPESIDANAPAWAWGPDGRGAVIPVNVDNDNANLLNAGDAEDNVINGVNDQNSDIARIEIRRHGGNNAVPGTWTNRLEILSPAGDPNPENNVRIFDDVAVGANEVVGPGTQHAALPAWPAGHAPYGMEATRYAGHDFTGVVGVRLTVSRPNGFGGQTSYRSEAQVRAAAWLMPNHLDRADTVYVSDIAGDADSAAFINALTPFVQRPENQGGAGAFLSAQAYNDQWMQDCMEIGYSTWPGTGAGPLRMEAVMRALRGRTLQNMPLTLRGVNFGYTYPGQGGGLNNTFNATGNLEVTPPADATNAAANHAGPKHYAWGRIYYGRGRPATPFNVATREFLERQTVQNPIALNTDWLNVGHVDEMMTFIPTPGGNKPWKLLIASPTRAYAILNRLNNNMDGGTPNTDVLGTAAAPRELEFEMWVATGTATVNDWDFDYEPANVNTTVGAMMGNGNCYIPKPDSPAPGVVPANIGDLGSQVFTWQEIRDWNRNAVQPVLNRIVTHLQDEISLDPVNDVIEVPIVFFPIGQVAGVPLNADRVDNMQPATPLNTIPGRQGGYVAGALTAGMVNMLVINRMLVVPQAFGPTTVNGDAFQLYLSQEIANANALLRVRYIDDWDLYHAQEGEVHCGTNTLRKPANGNDMATWLASAAAKWWDFPG